MKIQWVLESDFVVPRQGPRRVFESGVAKKCFQPRSGDKYFWAF